ncbi:MAG: DUF3078 domain-containing protein [Bacteroidales bacterium]
MKHIKLFENYNDIDIHDLAQEVDSILVPIIEIPTVPSGEVELLDIKKFKDTLRVLTWKDYWKFSGIVGLNFSQTGLWNWASGGNNNANGVLFANVSLTYKKKKIAWDTRLDTEFGEMYTSETTYPWRKSGDRISFNTKLGFEFKKTWFITVLGSFKSQYAAGYEYGLNADKTEYEKYVSNWLSPSYSDLSIGIDWKPNETFSVYISPFAGRITTCIEDTLNFRTTYGLEPDQKFKADLGFNFKATINFVKIKNFKVLTNIVIFTPYFSKVQRFGNFDVDWDFVISYQFLKVLNVSLFTALKYYDQVMITDKKGNVGPRVQFKEILGVGIGYSF